jgi:hypothetical protein
MPEQEMRGEQLKECINKLERLTAQIKEYYVAQDNMLAYNSSDEDIDRFDKVDNALRELVNMQIEGEQ